MADGECSSDGSDLDSDEEERLVRARNTARLKSDSTADGPVPTFIPRPRTSNIGTVCATTPGIQSCT